MSQQKRHLTPLPAEWAQKLWDAALARPVLVDPAAEKEPGEAQSTTMANHNINAPSRPSPGNPDSPTIRCYCEDEFDVIGCPVHGPTRPVLLDLFCKAGGCTKGYQRAGFYVIGVDVERQPNYCGNQFIQADALEYLRDNVLSYALRPVAVHASPPCQFATDYIRTGNVKESPNLIPATRELLKATGLPYVIENVQGAAKELRDPVLICGSMFDPPMDIRRHRLFEANWPLSAPAWPCRHKLQGPNRYPGGRSKERTGSNRGLARNTIEIGTWNIPYEKQAEAMGVDWPMTLPELSNAIPPAYCEHIGRELLAYVREGAKAA